MSIRCWKLPQVGLEILDVASSEGFFEGLDCGFRSGFVDFYCFCIVLVRLDILHTVLEELPVDGVLEIGKIVGHSVMFRKKLCCGGLSL